jgi:hypothetical protein
MGIASELIMRETYVFFWTPLIYMAFIGVEWIKDDG